MVEHREQVVFRYDSGASATWHPGDCHIFIYDPDGHLELIDKFMDGTLETASRAAAAEGKIVKVYRNYEGA